jgi:hypothetical protein
MKTQHVARLFLAGGMLLCLCVSSTEASFIFHVGAGAIQPNENLLFNEEGLADVGTTVEGITNNTGAIFEVISNDNPQDVLTTPSAGQARVEAQDGSYSSIMLTPKEDGVFFTQLEFNVNVLNMQSGTFSLSVLDQDGVTHQDDFDPNTLAQGENFFSVDAQDGMLIQKATLTANAAIIQDVRQIRLDGVVPEPSALALGLFACIGLLGLRRR